MKGLQERGNNFVCAEVSETFHSPVAHVNVVIMNGGQQNLRCPFRFDSTIA